MRKIQLLSCLEFLRQFLKGVCRAVILFVWWRTGMAQSESRPLSDNDRVRQTDETQVYVRFIEKRALPQPPDRKLTLIA